MSALITALEAQWASHEADAEAAIDTISFLESALSSLLQNAQDER